MCPSSKYIWDKISRGEKVRKVTYKPVQPWTFAFSYVTYVTYAIRTVPYRLWQLWNRMRRRGNAIECSRSVVNCQLQASPPRLWTGRMFGLVIYVIGSNTPQCRFILQRSRSLFLRTNSPGAPYGVTFAHKSDVTTPKSIEHAIKICPRACTSSMARALVNFLGA